jgi:hypothetical protein
MSAVHIADCMETRAQILARELTVPERIKFACDADAQVGMLAQECGRIVTLEEAFTRREE